MTCLTKAFAIIIGVSLILAPIHVQAEMSDDTQSAISALHEKTQGFIDNGELENALRNAQEAYDQSLEKLGADDPTTAILGLSLANLLAAVASTQEALSYYDVSLKRFEALYGVDSLEVASVLVYMSEWLSGEDQVAAVQRALEIQRKHQPENTLSYAQVAIQTGGYLALGPGTSAAAIPILEEARSILETEFGKSSVELIPVLMSLGNARARYRHTLSQKRLYRRAIRIAKKSGDAERHAELMLIAGKNLMEISGSRDARPFLINAHKLYSDLYGTHDARTAYARLNLARYYVSAGAYHQALANLRDSLKTFEQDDNYRNQQLSTLSLIVESYERLGNRDDATPYCRAIGEITPWTENQEMKPIFTQTAPYPRSAWKRLKEGHVVLEFTVSDQGFVTSQKVIEIEGSPLFEASALAASRTFRYAPRFVDGEPVETTNVRETFRFNLSDTRVWSHTHINSKSTHRLGHLPVAIR